MTFEEEVIYDLAVVIRNAMRRREERLGSALPPHRLTLRKSRRKGRK